MAKRKKKSNALIIILIVILAGVFLYSGYRLFSIWWGYHEGERVHSEVHDIFYAANGKTLEEITAATGEITAHEQTVEGDVPDVEDSASAALAMELLGPLKAYNGDTVGWITIPDSKMDYVVMQGVTNDIYLYRNFYRQNNSCGSIFMDADNVIGADLQNYIIYGHHMKDGSMFHDLNFYKSYEGYLEHPVFTLILEDGIYDCEVYAAILCTTNQELWKTSFATEEEKQAYIDECIGLSLYETGVQVSGSDKIVTLSTCEYTLGDPIGRLLVQAKLVRRKVE